MSDRLLLAGSADSPRPTSNTQRSAPLSNLGLSHTSTPDAVLLRQVTAVPAKRLPCSSTFPWSNDSTTLVASMLGARAVVTRSTGLDSDPHNAGELATRSVTTLPIASLLVGGRNARA